MVIVLEIAGAFLSIVLVILAFALALDRVVAFKRWLQWRAASRVLIKAKRRSQKKDLS